MDAFYDELAPFYHLIYTDWASSIARQATVLDEIVRQEIDGTARRVLDVSCGIGTQSLGLASLGYEVTASDLSSGAVKRAKREAAVRDLPIRFSVADMRRAFDHHRQTFDVVLSGDNSVPHLLSDRDIRAAFEQFYRCTRPGGPCLISVRDYSAIELGGIQVKPYGVRDKGDIRYAILQTWQFHGEIYDLTMYFVEDRGGAECRTHAFRSRYYGIPIDRLMALLREAGFEAVRRIDGRFFQPVVVGQRPQSPSLGLVTLSARNFETLLGLTPGRPISFCARAGCRRGFPPYEKGELRHFPVQRDRTVVVAGVALLQLLDRRDRVVGDEQPDVGQPDPEVGGLAAVLNLIQ